MRLALGLLAVVGMGTACLAGAPVADTLATPAVLDARPDGVGQNVRVLLRQGAGPFVVGLPQGGELTSGGQGVAVPESSMLRFERDGDAIVARGDSDQVVARGPETEVLEPAGQVSASHLHFAAEGHNEMFTLDGRPYRGHLEVRPVDGGLQLIDNVGLEAYLYGVVPRELSSDTLEAVRAQAVVSRTYAVGHLSPGHPYDVRGDTQSQAYAGFSVETIRTRRAIDDTAGQVLYYHGKVARDVCFHATCGGETAANEEVFAGPPVAYLRSVPCLPTTTETTTESALTAGLLPGLDVPTNDAFCSASPFFRWTVRWDRSMLEDSLRRALKVPATAGTLTEICPVALSATGRVERLEARFTGANEVLTGDAIRRALAFRDPAGKLHDLYSTWFSLQYDSSTDSYTAAGRGWGHGVGMCQWGAIGMARQGHTYDEILRHYFPGTELAALH